MEPRSELNAVLSELQDRLGTDPRRILVAQRGLFSGRARNILVNERIGTLGELASRTRGAVLHFVNCGKVTVREFETVLADHGLRLGMTDNLNLPDLIEYLYYFYWYGQHNPYMGWKEVGGLWNQLWAFVEPTRRALAERKKERGDG